MLVYTYLFSLILGGVLLGASVLLGGHDDADFDVDADADADFDADGDLDGDLDKELSLDAGDAGFLMASLKSVRFWTFFAAFFGMTGLSLELLDVVGPWVGLGTALGMGLGIGFGASAVIQALRKDTSGEAATSRDYIGKTARVMVPISPGGTGKVRVKLKGSYVDVLATADEGETFSSKEEALIIEMDGTRARIARLDDDGRG